MNPLAKWLWWSLDYLAAIVGQLRGVFLRTVPEAYARGDESLPIAVLIPGVYERWSFLAPLASRLNALGYRVLAVTELKANRMAVNDGTEVVRAAISFRGTGRYVLVGHSKGGLIGKAVLAHGVPGAELIGMVAIATPFAGSAYARFLPGRTLRGLSPEDETIVALGGESAVNKRIIAIQPRFDPHIPGERTLDGGAIVNLPASGHFRVLGQQATITAVVSAIVQLSETADSADAQ